MNRRRISQTLDAQAGKIVCRSCNHVLAVAGRAWKPAAALTTVPLRALPGSASTMRMPVVLRRFSCPCCGSLLDTETAMPDDPYLDDIVDVAEHPDGDH